MFSFRAACTWFCFFGKCLQKGSSNTFLKERMTQDFYMVGQFLLSAWAFSDVMRDPKTHKGTKVSSSLELLYVCKHKKTDSIIQTTSTVTCLHRQNVTWGIIIELMPAAGLRHHVFVFSMCVFQMQVKLLPLAMNAPTVDSGFSPQFKSISTDTKLCFLKLALSQPPTIKPGVPMRFF